MKKNNYILTAILIGIIAILIFMLSHSRQSVTPPLADQEMEDVTNQSPLSKKSISQTKIPPDAGLINSSEPNTENIQARRDRANEEAENEISMWQAPIHYFGKVVDENGKPISRVLISYGANSLNELRAEVYNTGIVTTDERGIFAIEGVKGIGLMLQLSHSNYYPFPGNSTSFDKRSIPKKGFFSDTEEKAELFRMHSKGHPVPLVHRLGGLNVPLDNAPATLDLKGSDNSQKIGQLIVQASGNPPSRYDQQPFDWGIKILVPGGGMIEYTNQFEFVAPPSGYAPSLELAFPKEMKGWTDTVSKNFFLKLPSGYARLNIYIGAKRPLFFSIDYYFNLDGSPNLELDSSRVIRPTQ